MRNWLTLWQCAGSMLLLVGCCGLVDPPDDVFSKALWEQIYMTKYPHQVDAEAVRRLSVLLPSPTRPADVVTYIEARGGRCDAEAGEDRRCEFDTWVNRPMGSAFVCARRADARWFIDIEGSAIFARNVWRERASE
jgi:hypothetical protein